MGKTASLTPCFQVRFLTSPNLCYVLWVLTGHMIPQPKTAGRSLPSTGVRESDFLCGSWLAPEWTYPNTTMAENSMDSTDLASEVTRHHPHCFPLVIGKSLSPPWNQIWVIHLESFHKEKNVKVFSDMCEISHSNHLYFCVHPFLH